MVNYNPTVIISVLNYIKSLDENSEIILTNDISPDFISVCRMFGLYFKVIYIRTDEVCSCCGGKLHSKGYQSRKPNGMSGIRVKKYVCSVCDKHICTDLNEFIAPNSMFTHMIKNLGIKISEIIDISFEDKTNLIEAILGTSISKTSVYNYEDAVADDYLDEKERIVEEKVEEEGLKDSGVYHHDEQFFKCNGIDIVRMVLVDSLTNYPYRDFVEDADKFDSELIEKFFHSILDDIPHEVMITDGYRAYPSIIKEFGMKQQRCVFHIMLNAGNDIFTEINKLKRSNKNKEDKINKKEKELEKNKEEYIPRHR